MNNQAKNQNTPLIFIIGSGRSGTTILYNLLAMHPDICFFSTLTNRFPAIPHLAIFHKVLDMPIIGNIIRKKIMSSHIKNSWILPNEGDAIYSTFSGFVNTRKTTAVDFNLTTYQKFTKIINTHKQATGKNILVSKQTSNTQRIALLHKMFPDAYWIHIIRDGRAVANSLYHVDWWKIVALWWIKKQPKNKQSIALCGRHWKTNIQEILTHKPLLKNHYIEIRYESLVKNPRLTISSIIHRLPMQAHKHYLSMIPKSLPNKNYKWETQLNHTQKLTLTKEIRPLLTLLKYTK